jgi:hypothetical protein
MMVLHMEAYEFAITSWQHVQGMQELCSTRPCKKTRSLPVQSPCSLLCL